MTGRKARTTTFDASSPEEVLFANREDPDARAEIVARYTPLANRLAFRYRGRTEPIDDLKQVAAMGLLHAINRFDPERQVKFASFAAVTMLGELRRHLRDKAWSARVPRSLQERWLEASRAAADLAQRKGRAPTIAEIAQVMGASAEDVLEAMDAGTAYNARSLDAPIGDEEGAAPAVDLLPEVDAQLETAHERVTVALHISELPDRERLILYLRFFEGLTQSEIAERIGISQMHVSRLLRRSLAMLRTNLAEDPAV